MENDKILDNLISGEVPIQNNGLVHFSDIQIPLKISFISLMSCSIVNEIFPIKTIYLSTFE